MRTSVVIRQRKEKANLRRDSIALTIMGILLFPLAIWTALTPGAEPIVVCLEVCMGMLYIAFAIYLRGLMK